MRDVTFRDATAADLVLLTVVSADFGQGHHDSVALADWMDPDWDFGIIAIDGEGRGIGAAWWRAFRAVTNGALNEELREPFVGVLKSHRGRGLGMTLLTSLVERARAAPGLRMLVARVAVGPHEEHIQKMVSTLRFTPNDLYKSRGLGTFWQLDVSR